MRHLKYHTLIVFLLLAWTQSKAQTTFYGKIDKFEVLPEYLVDGKIKINNEAYTEIKYKVGFVREFKTITPPTWMPFDVTVRLSTASDKGDIILFESPHNITIANFNKNNVFLDTVLTGRIDNSKVSKSRSIILSYIRNKQSFPNMSFDEKSYLIDQNSSPDPGPGPDLEPIVEADSVLFYSSKDNGGAYFISPTLSDTYRQSPLFYAYTKRVKGSKRVYGYKPEIDREGKSSDYEKGKRDYYSLVDDTRFFPDRTYKAFYAFEHQVKGTIPIYVYGSVLGKDSFYSKKIDEGSTLPSYKIAFYAFPYSRSTVIETPPTRPPRSSAQDFTIQPSQWSFDSNGKVYCLLSDIRPDINIQELQYLSILGGTIIIRDRTTRETISLPTSYKNNSYSYTIINEDVVISSINSTNTTPNENIEFRLQYIQKYP